MSNSPIAVTVTILDREYQIACANAAEEASVRDSAIYLDNKMREIRNRGNVIGIDRIAVMAALNIAHEYLELKPLQAEHESVVERISALKKTISAAIAGNTPPAKLI